MKRSVYRQRGVAAIEFGLLAVVLVLISFGITEFGRAFYQYNTLLKSTRAAAREMSFGSAANHIQVARCLAVYGHRTCTGESLLAGLTGDLVKFPPDAELYPGCVAIEGFRFISYVPWIVPDITFNTVRTCMPPGAA